MKYKCEAVKTSSYIAGIAVISASVLASVLLIMSAVGFFFPRIEKIVVETQTLSKAFDSSPLLGGEVTVSFGELHPGHEIKTLSQCKYTNVGVYDNAPSFIITDSSGEDVTYMYDISYSFGTLEITGIEITVFSPSKTKSYDGLALISEPIVMSSGILAEGHVFSAGAVTSITFPGDHQIIADYSIVDKNGVDVTDMYNVTEDIGTLSVLPRSIGIITQSKSKVYDGRPLSSNVWEHTTGTLLKGHKISGKCITVVTDVGKYANEIDLTVLDENGNDVSHLYEFNINTGTLSIDPMSLYIRTGSVSKEYDGNSVSSTDWSIIEGSIAPTETIKMLSSTQMTEVGSSKNEMTFVIRDKDGLDVTKRYDIKLDPGSINVTPRSITIRTGSAQKVYDGTPLVCDEYSITKGSLISGHKLDISMTSIVNVGYTQNFIVDLSIFKSNNGTTRDVTSNYRITFDYGTLTVRA